MKEALYFIACDPKSFSGNIHGDTLPSFVYEYALFAQLTKLVGYPDPIIVPIVPHGGLHVVVENTHEPRQDDYDGCPLTYVLAGELRALKITNDTHPINKAIKGFIDALPDDWPVVLVWG